MTGRLEGKVAFITGAGRGQGRSHAIRLAQEGADIIAVDICRQIESNPYPLSSPEDLAETERAVKELGRRVVTRQADVRERNELRDALDAGIRDLGRLDIVVANAGILPMAMGEPDPMDFVDATDVDLVGVMNAVAAAMPHLPDGASIIITGSTAGMMPNTTSNPAMGPGSSGYGWSKRVLISYTEEMALHLATRFDPGQLHPPHQLQHSSAPQRGALQRVPARYREPHPGGRPAGVHVFPGDADPLRRACRHLEPGPVPGF